MPDQNQLKQWRARMCRAGVCSKEVLAELENHLLEARDLHIAEGMDEAAAFAAAAASIGNPTELNNEFEKIPEVEGATPMSRRRRHMPALICCFYGAVLAVLTPALAKAGVSVVLLAYLVPAGALGVSAWAVWYSYTHRAWRR